MNSTLHAIAIAFLLTANTWAEPVKCLVEGKTVYTDDASRCGQNRAEPIKNNVSVFPEVAGKKKPAAIPLLNGTGAEGTPASNSFLDALLMRFGLSSQDVANGWETVKDAKKRGTWKAPEMPDDAE